MGKLGSWMLVMAMVVGAFLVVSAPLPVRAANVSLSLFGSASSGWGNTSSSITSPGPLLVVHQGDTVTITLTSNDGFPHQFLLDYNGNGAANTGEPESTSFSSTTTVTFTATQAGTFGYLCLFHPNEMKGTFVVQASSGTTTPPPSGGSPPAAGDNTLLIVAVVIVIAVAAGAGIVVLRRKPKSP